MKYVHVWVQISVDGTVLSFTFIFAFEESDKRCGQKLLEAS